MSLVTSLAGGPAVIAVAVAALFLIVGLLLLRAGTPRNEKRETPPQKVVESDKVTASEASGPAHPTKPARSKPPRQIPLQWTDDHGQRQTKLVEVMSSSEDEFSLSVEGEFKPGQTVWLADGDTLRRGAVKFHRDGIGARRMDVHLIVKDRRHQEREFGAGEANLHWAESGRTESTRVTIRNFSEDGLQVQSEVGFTAGQPVLLKGQKLNSPAVVLYSQSSADHYLIGLRFTGASRTQAVVPETPRQESAEPEEPTGSQTEVESVSALAERLSAPPKTPATRLVLTAPSKV